MGRCSKLLVLLVALLIILGLKAAPADLAHLLALGDQALAADQPELALEFYQQAARHPDGKPVTALRLAQAQLVLARQNATQSAYQAAWEAWLAAIPYEGLSLEVQRGLAETHLALGNTLAAAEMWAVVYAAEPDDPSLWYQLAPAHLAKEEWEAARQAYGVLASVESDNHEAHYWVGVMSLTADPAQAQTHLSYAQEEPAYRLRSQTLLEALAELPSIAQPAYRHCRLGVALLEAGEPALAQAQLEAALAEKPDYVEAQAYLGLAQDQQGASGRAAIARAIELAPDNALAHSLMGHHWLWHDRPDLALPEFRVANQLNPDSPVHLAEMATAYQLAGDLTAAEAWYQAAVRQAPRDPAFWVLLARFYLDSQDDVSDTGLTAALQAVGLAPDDPATLDTLGWAQFRSGQPALAESNLMAARERNPGDPAIHYHLGQLYADQERLGEAQAAFEQAVALGNGCRGCTQTRSGSYAELAVRALEQMRP